MMCRVVCNLIIAKEDMIMNKKVRWITETAVMLALLVALQALTSPWDSW